MFQKQECKVLTRNSLDLKMSIFRQSHYKFAIEYPLRVEGKNGTKLHLFLNYLNIGISNESCQRVAKKRILLTLQRIFPEERINCFVRHVIVFSFCLQKLGFEFLFIVLCPVCLVY